MKGDQWTWLNELLQNLVCAGIAAVWLYLTYVGQPITPSLNLAFAAVLVFLGLKSYKGTK